MFHVLDIWFESIFENKNVVCMYRYSMLLQSSLPKMFLEHKRIQSNVYYEWWWTLVTSNDTMTS